MAVSSHFGRGKISRCDCAIGCQTRPKSIECFYCKIFLTSESRILIDRIVIVIAVSIWVHYAVCRVTDYNPAPPGCAGPCVRVQLRDWWDPVKDIPCFSE